MLTMVGRDRFGIVAALTENRQNSSGQESNYWQ